MGQRIVAGAGLLGLAMLISGCAHYQYTLVQPGPGAQVIGKQPVRVEYPPLSYELAERNHRVAMQVNNPTDAPITLLGNRSYLVTPQGETRPVSGAVIAPHSFIGMIFPPAPLVYRGYPTVSWGMGFGYGPFWHPGWGFYGGPSYYGPTDYYVYPPHNWEWKKGNVRMLLYYRQASNIVQHQFLFNKAKVK